MHSLRPAPADYVRRIRLGSISATAAAREYLAAADEPSTERDVNRLANEWAARADGQRRILLGERTGQYRQRSRELLRHGLSTAAAESQAFAELAPDPATQEEVLAERVRERSAASVVDPVAAAPTSSAAIRFRPTGQADLAPSGEVARIRANLAAIRTLRTIQAAGRPATADEQAVLGRWSGWGAVPAALDPANQKYAWVRDELAGLLDEREMAAARRTVINAHYTDAALVNAIWEGIGRLGFVGGQVLEPGCGSGNFIAFAPDEAEVTGVELDPTTAAIAAALHPQAHIVAESFAHTRIDTGPFDAVVGNVPFGDIRLHDKRDNPGDHYSIHNHFIVKSLRATRPGGLVAVITSAYTMDATNPAARRAMQQMGDLIGAVRLPTRAHARAAGTDALTDVLVFRRREDDREPATFDWEYTSPVEVDGVALRINAYFAERPQRVLGRLAVGNGLYRRDEVSVAGDPAEAPGQLREAFADIAEQARAAGLTMTEHPRTGVPVVAAARLPTAHRQPDGYLRANPDGSFSRQDDGRWEPYVPANVNAKTRDVRRRVQAEVAELRLLLDLRDTAVALLEAEAVSIDDTAEIEQLRAQLNTSYDRYLGTYGPINRFTEKPKRQKDKVTGKMVPAVDEETGEAITRRERPRQGGFRDDPFATVVHALENFNEETQTATKTDIFHQRVVAPRPPRLGADTPADALAICLDDVGEVRLPTVAWLLGVSEEQARRDLGTLVYDDPATGRLEPAAAYLSGDVKTKLAIARNAADEDDRYAVNVAALEAVIPPDLTPAEITDTGAVKMGAPWMVPAYVQQFLTEILDDPTVQVEYGGGGMWSVSSERQDTVASRSTWGTDRRSAVEIAQTVLEQREFVIKDTVGRNPKRQVVNLDAIMAATEKAAEMRERFAGWIWEDPTRVAELVAKFNDTFQRYVLRNYDDVQLSLPGLSMTFKPDTHQVAAVARIIHEPAVGLYHCVGAGKTASMIMGAMELRRLGLVRKPVVVVPNQLLDQWTREFLKLYPQAKLLAASTEDLEKGKRRLLVSRIATGDWDAVILTESAFEMLPMSQEAEQAYVDAQMAELQERIDEARAAGNETTLKRLETKKANREARLEDRLDTDHDDGIWWELTGIDYIFRDESHRDKNLRTVSNVPGMSIKGSERAQQMDMKLAWVRERHARWGTRATGTPIANSIVELFTEYRYLRPDLMEQLGVTDVDSYLATFAEGTPVIEVTPDGGGLRTKTRFNFVNLEKLALTLHVFADVKVQDDLDLGRPLMAQRPDGQRLPEAVVVKPSAELLDKVAELVERAAKLRGRRPEKGADNILKIVGEGSAAALDLRLVGMFTGEEQKLDIAAQRMAAYYHDNSDRIYPGADGQPQPIPGAFQMAFCDLGTPSDKPDKWSAYEYLRQRLVAHGVPREKVRFIHDARDDRERAELFASCRDGRTAILVSSTEKGGTGVNVQDRLIALHHLDCPYRPCDLEQRNGRIDRRGNLNDEIHILLYITERSLDAFKWQKVAYKAKLAERVLTGRAGARTEDVGDVSLTYEEMKAAASGNPVLIDHAKAKAELARLERLERGYHRNQSQLRWTITNGREEIGINQALHAEAETAIAGRVDTHGDRFAMTVRGVNYTKRGPANDRLRNVLGLVLADPRSANEPSAVGELGGFAVTAKPEPMAVGAAHHRQIVTGLRVWLADAPGTELRLLPDDLKTGDLINRLENRLAKLESVRDGALADIARRQSEINRAEQDLAKPFRHQDALTEARDVFRQLDAQVVALAAASEVEAYAAERDGAEGGDEHGSDGQNPTQPAPAGAWQRSVEPTAVRAPSPGMSGATAGLPAPRPPAAEGGHDAPAEEALPVPLVDARLPEDQRRWVTQQVQRLAGDERLLTIARANERHKAQTIVDAELDKLFAAAVNAVDFDGMALAARYFDDDTFQSRLREAASFQLYAAAAANTPVDLSGADLREVPHKPTPLAERPAESPTPQVAAPAAPVETVVPPVSEQRSPKPATAADQATAPTPIDSRHPVELVACTCCRPHGRDSTNSPTAVGDPGEPPRGRLYYGARGDLGVLAGKRWLKVVTLREGGPESAVAFVDPTTNEWYPSASWRAPNKSLLDSAEAAWLSRRLPHLPAVDQPADQPITPPAAEPAVPAREHDDAAHSTLTAQPAAGPDEDEVVWIARARAGIPAHRLPPGAVSIRDQADVPLTDCGRSTRTGEFVTYREVRSRHEVALCSRCWPEAEGSAAVPRDVKVDQPLAMTGPVPDTAFTPAVVSPGATIYCPQRGCGRQAKVKLDGTIGAHNMYGRQPCDLVGKLVPPGTRVVRLPETTHEPAGLLALFGEDGKPVDDRSAEQRLMDKVAARMPEDTVGQDAEGRPTVRLDFVAEGTYGQVAGLDEDREPITAVGYVREARGLRGGLGGWSPETIMLVELAETPDGPVAHVVQTHMDDRLTVLDPGPDLPPGEAAPWLRMPVEQQILAARQTLGLKVEVRDGTANELWTVEGCPEQLTGEVAWWLFGGTYGSWRNRARPVFQQRRIDEAIAAGRYRPDARLADLAADPMPARTDGGPAHGPVEQQVVAAPWSPAEDPAGALHAAARRAIQGATTAALAPIPAESTQGSSEPTGAGEREPGGQSDAQAVRGAACAGASSGPHPAQLARMDTASASTPVGGSTGGRQYRRAPALSGHQIGPVM